MGVVVLLLLSLIWTTVMLSNSVVDLKEKDTQINQLTKQVDSLEVLSDSLKVELFPIEVQLGRYQVAYELFLERNPKAASQFGDIISEETE
jgi:Na+-transporting NADH:ubiquinone oxidoreductase subunit NqrC